MDPTPGRASRPRAFPRECRIRRGADFQRAYRRRCAVSDALLVLHCCENGLAYSRLGLSVSRKVGGAVVRNRWKRMLREAFRLSRADLPAGIDLVAIPRRQDAPRLDELLAALPALARRAVRRLKSRPRERQND